MPSLRSRRLLGSSVALLTLVPSLAHADPKLRHQEDLQGDVAVFGSTLAAECAPGSKQPVGATVSCAGQANVDDTAPDLFYRDLIANATITATQARTSATLVMPAGAKVKYARLYWAALKTGDQADKTATLDWDGGPVEKVTADDSWVIPYGFASHPDWFYYQASGDVTKYVNTWGAGDFRVTDVEAIALAGVDVDRAFSAWTMVVFYEKPGDSLRNLALFDGFTSIDPTLGTPSASVTLSGFLVPPGFDAKMAAFAYEGDNAYDGDRFTINGTEVSNAQNPGKNFFNSSRSYLGAPFSGSADVPLITGEPGTMAGYDLDTVDITSVVAAGDTSAKVGADSSYDIFLLGGFVTSITNKSPDFGAMTKTAVDVNGGVLLPGDEVEYTITSQNIGNDTAVGATLADVLDPGIELVAGSLKIVAGGAVGAKTNAKGDDEADYDTASRTITFRVGTGATSAAGGKVKPGETVTVTFRAKVVAMKGTIANQAILEASGEAGGPKKTWKSDGDPNGIGTQPTVVTVDECSSNADCKDPAKPHCDLATHTCQPCKTDGDCSDPKAPACNVTAGTCGQCSSTNQKLCTTDLPVCNTVTSLCDDCTPASMGNPGNATKCQTSMDGPVCVVGSNNDDFCGCKTDSDCGNATSGKVCDSAKTLKCIIGCRGVGGNGCPSGLVCTSKDSSIGQCVPGTGGSGGASGAAGSAGSAGTAGSFAGGAGGSAGSAGSAAAGSAGSTAGGSAGAAGGTAGTAGAAAGGAGGSAGSGAAGSATGGKAGSTGGSGGSAANTGNGAGTDESADAGQDGGCGCRAVGDDRPTGIGLLVGLGALGAMFGRRRRRD